MQAVQRTFFTFVKLLSVLFYNLGILPTYLQVKLEGGYFGLFFKGT